MRVVVWRCCVHSLRSLRLRWRSLRVRRTTNLAKRALTPAHAFRVRRISHRRTKTEVLRVEGDGEARQKNSPLLRFALVLPGLELVVVEHALDLAVRFFSQ